jgi:hypothetical protein
MPGAIHFAVANPDDLSRVAVEDCANPIAAMNGLDRDKPSSCRDSRSSNKTSHLRRCPYPASDQNAVAEFDLGGLTGFQGGR